MVPKLNYYFTLGFTLDNDVEGMNKSSLNNEKST